MNDYQQNANKRRLQMRASKIGKFLNIKPKSVTSLMVIMFFMVGAFYIVIVNVVATKGTDLRILDVENRQLESENQRLEVEAARLKSLKVINESATGEVEVGEEPTSSGTTEEENQPVTLLDQGGVVKIEKVEPKLVPQKGQRYLPTYGGVIASR